MKKVVAALMTMSLLLCLCAGAMADAMSNVPYIVRGWDETAKTVTQTETTAASCTVVTSSDTAWGTAGQKSWYVVRDSVTIGSRITVNGDVHLILRDGKTLTAKKGIETSGANSLTIYGQSADSGTLEASAISDDAGIGGSMNEAGGTITIHGGTVTATCGSIGSGAGIGGGYEGDGGTITIYGGTVNASGNRAGISGAGIGGGYNGAGGTITIHGGTVEAISESGGAGIGGGDGGSGRGGAGGTIRIAGGTVNASSSTGAGIGGGGGHYGGAGGEVTITGGTVTAWGKRNMSLQSQGCAIGGGKKDAKQGSLTVSGDQVVMTAGNWKDYNNLESFQIFDAREYLEKNYAYAHIEVTNKPAGEESGNVSLPQTGDPSMLGAWALLLGASAAGLKLRRKK